MENKSALPSTVGALLESTIHSEFTEAADTLYGMAYLNRDQRIALSTAIGNALAAFTKEVGDISNIQVAPDDVDMVICDDDDMMDDMPGDMGDMQMTPDMQDTTMPMTGMDSTAMPMTMTPAAMQEMQKRKLMMMKAKFGGVPRSELKDSDFLFPKERSFPIKTPQDVADAVSSWGRATKIKKKYSFEEFKKRLIAKARGMGKEFAAKLPASWTEQKAAEELLTEWLVSGSKALYDRNKSEYFWCGVSHNAWQDRQADIIPLALIEEDIAVQKALIKAGKLDQFGYGLWIDHSQDNVIGTCTLREIVPGGRSCFEMGDLTKADLAPKEATMSIGYHYALKAGGEYDWVVVYERSALKDTRAINARTFFNVHRRQVLSDAVLSKSIQEMLAAATE